jgi:hypothetical protein
MAYDPNNIGFNSLRDTWGGGGVVVNRPTGGGGISYGFRGGAAGMGGNGSTAGDGDLAGMLQKSFEAANQANQLRYEKMIGLAQQFGMAQTAEANRMHQQNLAQGQQSLISRGLGNSTVVNSVNTAANARHQEVLGGIAEKKAALELGVHQQHQDIGPDLAMYLQAFSAKRAPAGGGGMASGSIGWGKS